MDATERKELMQYLKDAIQQERDILTQTQIVEEYDESSERRKPILQKTEIPSEPGYSAHEELGSENNDRPIIIICLGFLVAFLIILFGVMNATNYDHKYFDDPYYANEKYYKSEREQILETIERGKMEVVIGIFIAVLCFLPIIALISKNRQINAKNNRLKEQYHKEVEAIVQSNNTAEQEYIANLAEWRLGNDAMHTFFQGPLEKSKALLAEFYNSDRIYPKYHNLPALTSIYEYFITGRCDELTGPHGAYNLYEDEVRKDTVIAQMNAIIENLEQIKQNQYMLYEQVRGIQQDTLLIAQELDQIRGYTVQLTALTALNTYYSELSARNTAISAAYHLLN